MSNKKELETQLGCETQAEDPELDELLDSALQDLTKGIEKKEAKKEVQENATAEDEKVQEWTDDFIKNATKSFESNMANLISGTTSQDPATVDQSTIEMHFKKMAEAAAQVISNPSALEPSTASNDISTTITQTLQSLSLGSENLQNPFSDQDFMNMFGGESENAFLPFMQGMMQSILSKEILLPSLKDILEKYPAWLESNKSKLEPAELERYTKQKELMSQVCSELETEKDSDSEIVKRERFDKVLKLMQRMQDLGQPPQELVGDMGPQLQFDANGQPILPEGLDMNNLEQNCCVM